MTQEAPSTLYDPSWGYDALFPQGPCEGFYRRLAQASAGPVLELACGIGHLAIPIAGNGHEVSGLDTSPFILIRALAKADAEGLRIDIRVGDMRTFELETRFPLIVLSCNSLGHLTSKEEIVDSLRRVARHLRPDGIFAFDVPNPRPDHLAAFSCEVRHPAQYDVEHEVPEATAPIQLRMIFPQELTALLTATGLELIERFGDFDGGAFTAQSNNQVCLARRRILQ